MELNPFNMLFNAIKTPVFIWQYQNGEFVLNALNQSAKDAFKSFEEKGLNQTARVLFKENKGIVGSLRACYDFRRNIEAEGWYRFDFSEGNRYYDFKYTYIGNDLVALFVDDITHQIEIEEDAQLYFETAIDMLCITHFDGSFIKLSPTWSMTLGWDESEFLQRTLIEFVHPDDQEGTGEAITALQNGSVVIGYTNRFLCSDGTYKWLEWNATSNLERRIIISAARDVTLQKKAERALKESLKAADEANKAKSEFLANMSHEIRTPLNAVIGFSELLKDQVVEERLKDYVKSINTSGKNLLHLVNDILDLSKLEAGMLDTYFDNMSIVHCFNEIEQMLSQKMKDKKLTYELHIAPDVPANIIFDEVRLKQIFMNLIGNAIKFTPRGGIKVSVATMPSLSTENGHVSLVFSVEDSGVGISESDLENIFKSFTQTGDIANHQGGTGLGLAISKKLIDLLKGRISVKSHLGKGTTFTLCFDNVEVTKESSMEKQLPQVQVDYHFCNAKVLVVDDDDINRYLVREVLSTRDVDLHEARNGAETLNITSQIQPDLILMDIRLPDMSGFEIASEIKKNEELKTIPIVALTASLAFEENNIKMSNAFDAVLTKPVGIAELLKIMSGFIDHQMFDTEKTVTQENNILLNTEDLNRMEHAEISEWIEYIDTFSGAIKLSLVYELAEDMMDYFKDHNMSPMYHWSNELIEHAEAFNIGHINLLLSDIRKALNDAY